MKAIKREIGSDLCSNVVAKASEDRLENEKASNQGV